MYRTKSKKLGTKNCRVFLLVGTDLNSFSLLFSFGGCLRVISFFALKLPLTFRKKVSEQQVPELPYQDFFVFSFQDSTIKISDHTIKRDNFCITLIGCIFMQASYGRGYLFSKELSVSNQSRLE